MLEVEPELAKYRLKTKEYSYRLLDQPEPAGTGREKLRGRGGVSGRARDAARPPATSSTRDALSGPPLGRSHGTTNRGMGNGGCGGDKEAVGVLRGVRESHPVWRVWLPACGLVLLLLAGVGVQLGRVDAAGRSDLRNRFALRAALAGRFTESFVGEIQARERAQAGRWLSGRVTSARSFEEVAGSFGFDAAVLLDRRGRVLAVLPRSPDLLGTPIAQKYPHLRAAVQGRAALSPIVLSAARRQPIVASAVPYQTPTGRRVFSGGFQVAKTPLGAYLRTTASIPGSAFALVDRTGKVVVGSDHAAAAGAAEVLRGDSSPSGYYVVSEPVRGAPWRISAAVPAKALYAPLGHRRLFSALVFAALSGASMVALLLLYRLLRRKDELHRLSRIDPLTGLVNRRALQDAYRQRLAYQARYGGREGALLAIDLDNFKQVNDRYGHQAGDRLLVAVAQTLRTTLRESDLAARLGGDEFAILLPRATAQDASAVAQKLRSGFEDIASPGSTETSVKVRASIGFALEAETEPSLDAILSAADQAMYRQKVPSMRRKTSTAPRALPQAGR